MKWIWLSLLVLILDQISKLVLDASLTLYDPVSLLPFFNLRLAYNAGAAFSFLGDASGWQRWFFIILALVVIAILLVWLRRLGTGQTRLAVALALILGGALGNLVDRVLYGYVIDFIDLYYGTWHWPTFNVADSAITIGAALMLLDAFAGQRKRPSVSA